MTAITSRKKPPRQLQCTCGKCRACQRRKRHIPVPAGASRIMQNLGQPHQPKPQIQPPQAPVVPGSGGCDMDRACPMPAIHVLHGRRCCLYHHRLFGYPEIMGRRREESEEIHTRGWRRPMA